MKAFIRSVNMPEEYIDEFRHRQMLFGKKRIRLYCALSIVIYFLATALWAAIYPGALSKLEIIVGLMLVAGALVISFFNSRVEKPAGVKINAYLFTMLLLVLLVKLGIYFNDTPEAASASFVFTLFLVASTFPWKAIDVVFIGIMHLLAYTFNIMYISFGPHALHMVSLQQYLDGFIFIGIAVFLCSVIRKNERNRDMENFILLKKVETSNEQMKKELEWARRVHKTIIPESIKTDKVDIDVTYMPVYYIGGDYARFDFLTPEKLIFIISDVTGHGVPAALLVNRLHAEFERLAKEYNSPGVLLKELNGFIKEDFGGSEMYLSAFCGMIDFDKMMLDYSNYGHPSQYIYSSVKSDIRRLSSQTSLLGVPLEDDNVYDAKIKLEKGDKLLLFTDGVTETVNSTGEQYGAKRLEDFLGKNHNDPVDKLNTELIQDLISYKTGSFRDDICVMSFDIKA